MNEAASVSHRSERALCQAFLPSVPQRVDAFMWKFSNENGGVRPRHFHSEPEVNLIVHGWAEFGVGKKVVRVQRGELIGFPPGLDHVLLGTSPDVFLFALGMAPMWAAEASHGSVNPLLSPVHLRIAAAEQAALFRQSELLVEKPGVEQAAAAVWEQLSWLSRRSESTPCGSVHTLTQRAISTLAEGPELGLEAIARHCRGNASEVSRQFHKDMGIPFARYRSRVRLLRFMELAQEPGTWGSAAIAAGFGSYSQCHRSFQAELGCSPNQYFRHGQREAMQSTFSDGSQPQNIR